MRLMPAVRCFDTLKHLPCIVCASQCCCSSNNAYANKRTFYVGSVRRYVTKRQHTLRTSLPCLCSRQNLSFSTAGNSTHTTKDAQDWDSVPIVKAFVCVPKDSSSNPIVGVYWDDNSKQNRFKEYGEKTKIAAEIEAVSLALKQAALKMNLPRIRIVTNSKFICKHFGKTSLWWNLEEFLRQKSITFSFCSAEAADLYRLLHMIEAKVEYDPSVDEIAKKFYKNLTGIKEENGDEFNSAAHTNAPQTSISLPAVPKRRKMDTRGNSKTARTSPSPVDLRSLDSNTPIVYTCGVLHSTKEAEKEYARAGYGIYWPHSEELGAGRRYSFYPITLVRCQLQAIIEALQQAVDQNYRSIILRTDCISFLVHHSRQWLKANGSYVKYHDQYLRIMELCKSIKVNRSALDHNHFPEVRFQPANDPTALREAEALAENGICLPLPSRRFRKATAVAGDNTSDDKISLTSDIKHCT